MTARPWVLGISCSHNGSACLLHGDDIVAAVQDERIVRYKRQATHARYVTHCVGYCLDAAGIRPENLDLIVYSVVRGPGPHPKDDIHLNELLRPGHSRVPVQSITHHYAHAVSAFATSGFDDAAVLVIDGSGTVFGRLSAEEQAAVINVGGPADMEWLSYYEAADSTITPVLKQVTRPPLPGEFFSLGDMYGTVGGHLFESFFDGPGKLMGLAPYGTP